MELDLIKAWLRRKAFAEAAGNALGSLAALVGAFVVIGFFLGATFLFLPGLLRGFGPFGRSLNPGTRNAPFSGTPLILFSVIIVAGLFIGHEWRRRERRKRAAELAKVEPWARSMLMQREDVAVELLADVLFAGPRLAYASAGMLRKSLRLLRLDVAMCSRVILVLLGRSSRFSFREICTVLPELNPTKVFPQLNDIVGIVFLSRDAGGLTLTQDLRAEILGALRRPPIPAAGENLAAAEHDSVAPVPPIQKKLPPHEALGVDPEISLPELEKAYHRLMKENDPNRVSGLGPELEEIAQEKAEDIYEAYRALLEKHDRSRNP